MIAKKIWLVATLASAAIAISTCVSAAENAPGSGPNPFSECGIGAALFPKVTWAAVSSNIIWDVGTTAVTSATASPQTCNSKEKAAALFIRDTYDQLAEETAAGQGEHLTTALDIFGCDSANHAAATQQVRAAMGRMVAAKSYADLSLIDKASGFYSIVETAASTSCSG